MLGLLLLLASSCPEPAPRNCATRIPFYPDADGDGFGEPTAVFYGCEAPDGWVAVLAPIDSGLPTAETGTPPPTGDTGVSGETGVGDTATSGETADTGP